MATGTSVVGIQYLVEDGAPDSQFAFVDFNPDVQTPPRRVGFLWLLQGDISSPKFEYVVDARVLYYPSVYYLVPVLELTADVRYKLVADWNVAGLEWEAFVYAP